MDKFVNAEQAAHARALHRELGRLIREANANREPGTPTVFMTKEERAGLVAFMLRGPRTKKEEAKSE